MVGTGRFMNIEGSEEEVEIDTDVLVTEQRMRDMGLPEEVARKMAPDIVNAALNTVCPCCAEENGHGLPEVRG